MNLLDFIQIASTGISIGLWVAIAVKPKCKKVEWVNRTGFTITDSDGNEYDQMTAIIDGHLVFRKGDKK